MNDISNKINILIDNKLIQKNNQEEKRKYIGASEIGDSCNKKIQNNFIGIPREEFSGRLLKIFQTGHLFEYMAHTWLTDIGFEIITEFPNKERIGFSLADGRLQGHVDGIITSGPKTLELNYPIVWECKTWKEQRFKSVEKNGALKTEPKYAYQIALYQAYLEPFFPGVCINPALLTSINKNTSETIHELIPFDKKKAQEASDRAVHIIKATEDNLELPKISLDKNNWHCKMCEYNNYCHS